MPSVMNRFKSNLLVKLDKENENKNIKRKMTRFITPQEKILMTRAESVWDRLSKVKKTPSIEGSVGSVGTNGRPPLATSKSTQRMAPQRINVSQPKSALATKKPPPVSSISNTNKRLAEKKPTKRVQISKATITTSSMATMAATVRHKKSAILTGALAAATPSPTRSPTPSPTPSPRTSPPPRSLARTCDNKLSCKPVTSVKELLTVRSICNSKSSSDDSKKSPKMPLLSPDTIEDLIEDEMEMKSLPDSFDEYEMAPLMTGSSINDSLNHSDNISTDFRNILEQKQRSMPPEDITMIKKVIKTDERYRQLTRDDSNLFKEILRTQLQEIYKQELVVKCALKNLDDSSLSSSVDSALASYRMRSSCGGAGTSHGKKPQVDVIFKNVPTLEKEIIILKALGEKLEATLERTVSLRSMTSASWHKLANNPYPYMTVFYEINMEADNERRVLIEIRPIGIVRILGFIREFRIARKTIVELKEQENRHFYLPIGEEENELKRTSFRRLKNSPDILMRHLRSKNTLVPFNVLDQDPMFFNSFLHNNATTGRHIPQLSNTGSEATMNEYYDTLSSKSSEMITVRDSGGDNGRTIGTRIPYEYMQEKEPLMIEEISTARTEAQNVEKMNTKDEEEKPKLSKHEISSDKNAAVPKKVGEIKKNVPQKDFAVDAEVATRKPFEAPIRGKQRRRIRRGFTPMPLNKDFEPKHNIVKTILVGAVQISVFLLLIMAITYPDVKC